MYSKENVKAWIEAEKNLGITKSVFITINGTTTQYYDEEEGENFYDWVEVRMKEELWFNDLCEDYFKAIKLNNLIAKFECIVIFTEIDEHPEIATEDQLRRLKRLRESTHEEIYK